LSPVTANSFQLGVAPAGRWTACGCHCRGHPADAATDYAHTELEVAASSHDGRMPQDGLRELRTELRPGIHVVESDVTVGLADMGPEHSRSILSLAPRAVARLRVDDVDDREPAGLRLEVDL